MGSLSAEMRRQPLPMIRVRGFHQNTRGQLQRASLFDSKVHNPVISPVVIKSDPHSVKRGSGHRRD